MARRLGVLALLVLTACGGQRAALTGQELAADVGCLSCHGEVDSSVAPTLNGLWGTEVVLEDGRSVTVDEAYVRRAITDPSADVVEGFRAVMPTFGLSDDEVDRLVEYVGSLG